MALEENKAIYAGQTLTIGEYGKLQSLTKKGILTATGVSSEDLNNVEILRQQLRQQYPSEKAHVDEYYKKN